MDYYFQLKVTPRLAKMLDASQIRAERRGDGYLGAEHLLEAILNEPDSVPGQIIASYAGLRDSLRLQLADYFAREAARRTDQLPERSER